MRRFLRTAQAGFTLIEIMVIAPIVILAIGAFVTVIISMTGEVLASRGSNALTYNIQDAMNRIEEDVKLSTTFLAQNDISPLSTGQGYDDATSDFTNAGGANGTALILRMLVTNGNPLSLSTGIVYLADQPNACASSAVQANKPMTMNVVYFVKPDPNNNNVSTLWRRTIMPSNYETELARCSTPWQQPSCAVGYVASFCKTNDVKLVAGVPTSGFFVRYFSSAAATTPNTTASTAPIIANRNAALASTPTVGVSIVASQSIAGRTVERSATLRATRLETNASTVTSSIITEPSTPVVTGSVTNGETASFSWPIAGGGNVTYDVDYNINGGSWTNALTGTTNRSYSRIALRGQTVNVRVQATNSVGTSDYGTTSTQIPLWNTVPLQNNWTNYDTAVYGGFGYTKTTAGLVVLKGLIKRTGTPVSSEVIATLPVGFRPPTQLMIQVGTNNTGGRLLVMPSGEIQVVSANAGWLSLVDISFISSTAGYTATTLSTVPAWINYGGLYDPASSITDSAGRTNLTGLLKSGSTSSEVNMVAFASGTTPPKRVYLPSAYNGTWGLIIADPSGYMKTATTSATYTSINSKFYPAARPDGSDCTISWCSLTMSAGWVPYGNSATNYPQPQYTKGSDGLVMLRGLIKSGTTTNGTVMATLPDGYRPKERMIFQANASGGYGRVDIMPTGAITAQGVSATYTAFDGIYFMTD